MYRFIVSKANKKYFYLCKFVSHLNLIYKFIVIRKDNNSKRRLKELTTTPPGVLAHNATKNYCEEYKYINLFLPIIIILNVCIHAHPIISFNDGKCYNYHFLTGMLLSYYVLPEQNIRAKWDIIHPYITAFYKILDTSVSSYAYYIAGGLGLELMQCIITRKLSNQFGLQL